MSSGKQKSTCGHSCPGEDGDFVQLRILREQKQAVFKLPPEVDDEVTDSPLLPRDRSSSRDFKGTVLFKAIDEDDLEQVKTIIASSGQALIRDVKHPETDQNVFLYALSQGHMDIATLFMNSNNIDLLVASTKTPGQQNKGSCNALHILVTKNEFQMAKRLLELIPTKVKRKALIIQETAVDIAGQRSRLFPCLHLAAFHGHSEFVTLFLDQGIDVNMLNGKEDTALLWAARWAHNNTVSLLLTKGANPQLANDKGSTPLYWAVRYGHVDTAQQLLVKGKANPNVKRKVGLVAPLMVASAYGNLKLVSLLLKHGADVDMKIRGGEMAVHHAAMEGHLDVLNFLLSNGGKMDERDELGNTPLLLAAREGWTDVVKSLIWRGADISHNNNDGYDVWDFAIHADNNALLRTLMKEIKEVSEKRKALFIAARAGNTDKIQLLIDMGISPGLQDAKDLNTILHHAAIEKKHSIIENFHSIVSVNVQNKFDMTPLMYACTNGDIETIGTLLKCKAKTDIKDVNGSTALHYAAKSEHISSESVRELVHHAIQSHSWASLNERNKDGQNCLHLAGKHAKPDVMWEFRQVRLKDRDDDGRTPLHMTVRPDEPDALYMMLNVFESIKRDANINEQTYDTGETVLHLAVKNGDVDGVTRLIRLGADLAVTDRRRQHSALHMAVWCYREAQRQGNETRPFLEIVCAIIESADIWWCIKENIPHSTDEHTDLLLTRQAFWTLVYEINDSQGKSVMQLAFDCCATEIISRLLTWDNITMSVTADHYMFDVTALTPLSHDAVSVCCGQSQISPLSQKADIQTGTTPISDASGLELLIKGDNSLQHVAEVLDIPPIRLIEHHYSFLVSRMYSLLLFLHIVYMSLFTYIGLDLQVQLRENASHIDENDPEFVLLYSIVPLEPLVFFALLVYMAVSSCCGKGNRGSSNQHMSIIRRLVTVVKESGLLIMNVAFSLLIVTWIVMFSVRYEYQDIVLAVIICTGWLLTISFTKGIKNIHYFYKMVKSMIVRDIVRFLIVYLFVLLAFGFAFHILFQVSKYVSAMYPHPGDTLFLMFDMMLGMGELFSDGFESGMEEAGRSPTYMKAFYILYMVLTMIVLLNLLIAMMNDSYSTILNENSVTWRVETVNLGMQIEKTFPASRVLSNRDSDLRYGPLSVPGSGDDIDTDRRWNVQASCHQVERMREENNLKQTTSKDFVSKRLDYIEQGAASMQKQLSQISRQLEQMASAGLSRKRSKKVKENGKSAARDPMKELLA